LARTDYNAARWRVEPHHIQRVAGGDAEPAPLPDREMDDPIVTAEHATIEIDDVARLGGTRPQALDHLSVAPGRDKADVLAVVLVGDRKTELSRKLTRLGLAALAKRKAQEVELLARGRK